MKSLCLVGFAFEGDGGILVLFFSLLFPGKKFCFTI